VKRRDRKPAERRILVSPSGEGFVLRPHHRLALWLFLGWHRFKERLSREWF